jgi:hypothetical protein
MFFQGKELKKHTLIEASISHPKTVKVQSQCVRVTLLEESVCNNHSFGSSGLLGVWRGDREETPMKFHLT